MIVGFQIRNQRANQFVWFNTITIIITTPSWGPRGVGKTRFQHPDHDTQGREKRIPTTICCGKNKKWGTVIIIIIVIRM